MRFGIVAFVLSLPCLADEPDVGQRREILSAILCIDLDVQAEAKQAIKDEYANAKISGGGVVDLAAIKESQDEFARAGKEATSTKKQLSAIRSKPQPCSDIARVYNCVNHMAEINLPDFPCDIVNFHRFKNAILSMRTGDDVQSSRLYTFNRK